MQRNDFNLIAFVKLETLETTKDATIIIMKKDVINLYFNFYCSIKFRFTNILLQMKFDVYCNFLFIINFPLASFISYYSS